MLFTVFCRISNILKNYAFWQTIRIWFEDNFTFLGPWLLYKFFYFVLHGKYIGGHLLHCFLHILVFIFILIGSFAVTYFPLKIYLPLKKIVLTPSLNEEFLSVCIKFAFIFSILESLCVLIFFTSVPLI